MAILFLFFASAAADGETAPVELAAGEDGREEPCVFAARTAACGDGDPGTFEGLTDKLPFLGVGTSFFAAALADRPLFEPSFFFAEALATGAVVTPGCFCARFSTSFAGS